MPNKVISVVIWGDKMTGDISQVVRFHASKEVARKYLQTRRVDKWPSEWFGKIDWKNLDLLAVKDKLDMYKIWKSTQNLGFCCTRAQLGRYS